MATAEETPPDRRESRFEPDQYSTLTPGTQVYVLGAGGERLFGTVLRVYKGIGSNSDRFDTGSDDVRIRFTDGVKYYTRCDVWAVTPRWNPHAGETPYQTWIE